MATSSTQFEMLLQDDANMLTVDSDAVSCTHKKNKIHLSQALAVVQVQDYGITTVANWFLDPPVPVTCHNQFRTQYYFGVAVKRF